MYVRLSVFLIENFKGSYPVIIRNQKELDGLLRIGQICGQTLLHMAKHVEPGITTRQLDDIGAAFLQKHNARSAPITAYKYPGWTCISVNDEAAHGISIASRTRRDIGEAP